MTPEQLAKSNTEHAHQRALFARVNEFCFAIEQAAWHSQKPIAAKLRLLFAIPNGGQRHGAVAAKMKAEGAKAGVWDLFLPVPRNYAMKNLQIATYHGLFIEMKEPGRRNHANGGLSDKQVEFRDAMQAQGYATAVAYTWEEAFGILLKYLGG